MRPIFGRLKQNTSEKSVVGNVSHKIDDSPVWHDLLKVKNLYLTGSKHQEWGPPCTFWVDNWWRGKPLCTCLPLVFQLYNDKNIAVKDFFIKK